MKIKDILTALSVFATIVFGVDSLVEARVANEAASASAYAAEQSADEAKKANQIADRSLAIAVMQADQDRPRFEMSNCDSVNTIEYGAKIIKFFLDQEPRTGFWVGNANQTLSGRALRCSISNMGTHPAIQVAFKLNYEWGYYASQKPLGFPPKSTWVVFSSIRPNSETTFVYFVNMDHSRPLLVWSPGVCEMADSVANKNVDCDLVSYPGKPRTIHPGVRIVEAQD